MIRRGDLILAGFNPKWDSFSLPMTKRRYWPSEAEPGAFDAETWEKAACRCLEEWLPRADGASLKRLAQVGAFRQSDRALVVKDFQFEVFVARVDDGQPLRPDLRSEWLAVDDFCDLHRRPISPTARHLIKTLQASGRLK